MNIILDFNELSQTTNTTGLRFIIVGNKFKRSLYNLSLLSKERAPI